MSEKLVIVFETPDRVELEMARNLLIKAEIPCTVGESGAASVITSVLGAGFMGVQTLQVRESDAERACELLEEAWGEGHGDAAAEGEAQ